MENHNPFVMADRKRTKIKIGLDGPSGSGKTFSALLLAKGLGGRIAFIDTEGGSGLFYADLEGMPDYDHLGLDEFGPENYINAINNAVAQKYDVVIIDSLSHAWAGKGGILDLQAKASMGREENNWTAWRKVTPLHNALVDTLIQAKIHKIVTLRTQTAWEMEEYKTQRGATKKRPTKIGMKPIQREGLEYEFDIVWDLNNENYANASKDRTSFYKGKPMIITEEIGKSVMDWILKGKEMREPTWQDHFLTACSTNDNIIIVSKMLERAGLEQFKARQHYHNAITEYCETRGIHILNQEQLNGFVQSPNMFFNGFVQWRIDKASKDGTKAQPVPVTQPAQPEPAPVPASEPGTNIATDCLAQETVVEEMMSQEEFNQTFD